MKPERAAQAGGEIGDVEGLIMEIENLARESEELLMEGKELNRKRDEVHGEYDEIHREHDEIIRMKEEMGKENSMRDDEDERMIEETKRILAEIETLEYDDERYREGSAKVDENMRKLDERMIRTREYARKLDEHIRRTDEYMLRMDNYELRNKRIMRKLDENMGKIGEYMGWLKMAGMPQNGEPHAADATVEHDLPGTEDGMRTGSGDAARMRWLSDLDDMAADSDRLYAATGFVREEFDHLFERFDEAVSARPDPPPFSSGEYADPENRDRLGRRHALLMALMRKRINVGPLFLCMIECVGPDSISRYVGFADRLLREILPTSDRITKRLQTAGAGIQEEIIPGGTVLIDRLRVPVLRTDGGSVEGRPAGKTAANTMLVSNRDGLILAAGRTSCGPASALRDESLDPVLASCGPGTDRIVTAYVSPGCMAGSDIPGIRVVHLNRKPRDGKLVIQPKRRFRGAGDVRVVLDHAVGRIGRHRAVSVPYDRSMDEFHDELVIVTGLANFHLLWDAEQKCLRTEF